MLFYFFWKLLRHKPGTHSGGAKGMLAMLPEVNKQRTNELTSSFVPIPGRSNSFTSVHSGYLKSKKGTLAMFPEVNK